MIRSTFLVLLFLLISEFSLAQYIDLQWTFGDSCGIQFNTSGIDSFYRTAVNARGTCASITDNSGALLFYAASPDYNIWNSFNYERGAVYNRNHQVMQNGLFIKTSEWYHEMVILPDPGGSGEYYLFTAGVTNAINPGLRYTKIDLNQNGGLGAVTQKNVMLDPLPINDGITAVKHGNGRDWWLICKHSMFPSDTIYTYLVCPQGIIPQAGQKVGTLLESGFYRIAISPSGNRLAGISMRGRLELFDFDRCTGLLSNRRVLRQSPDPPTDERDNFWGAAFSPNGRYLYVSTNNINSYLFQLDLLDSTPFVNKVMLDSIDIPITPASDLKRGPDGRIYRAIAWNDPLVGHYPYPDTLYNFYNTHLGVINYPDSAGTACDFQPWSIYLPNCRTYYGLPNNPDYTLGVLFGSPCDTLSVSLTDNDLPEAELLVYPNPFSQAFSFRLRGGVFMPDAIYTLFNSQGALVESGRIQLPEQRLEITNGSPGIYLLMVESGNKVFSKKLLKE